MTTASGIAPRTLRLLYDPALRSSLDILYSCLSIPRVSLQHPTLLLPGFLIVALIYSGFLLYRNLKQKRIETRAALQALVAVLAPTCSLWTTRYLKLASATHARIDIPLEVVIKDTINGVVEFRNPIDDLADFIRSGSTVRGHTICVNIGWNLWIKYFGWWILAKEARVEQFKLGLSGWSNHTIPDANPSDLTPVSFALASSTSLPLPCLDCQPLYKLPKLKTGSEVVLEFTAFSPSLREFSTAQIISAIPFMISERPCRRPRSVVSVLKQLRASHDPIMAIGSISNVSVDYEHALCHLHKSLSEKQEIRETWVKFRGMNIWRQEMFLVALEAALVRRGWIERWAVQVTVK